MPVFEYRCRQCGSEFEYLMLHSSPQAECPTCHARDLEQLISLSSISSETTRQANLNAAHARAAAARSERQRQEHAHLHDHFEDTAKTPDPPRPAGPSSPSGEQN